MTFREAMAETGYDTKTTFWDDFSIADRFGNAAIQDTFNRAFDEWKSNTVFVTELALVLNHKSYQWHEKDKSRAELYTRLWQTVDDWCIENLKDDDAMYYYEITD